VEVAAFTVGAGGGSRHAIVMLSDGENDTTEATTAQQSLDAARNSRAPVFAIGFGTGADPAYLGQLGDVTGGRFFAASTADVAEVYGAIADQLRGQYAITMTSPAPGDGSESSLLLAAVVGNERVVSAPFAFQRGEAPVVAPTTAPPPVEEPASESESSNLWMVIAGLVGFAVVGGVGMVVYRRASARRRQRERDKHAGRQSDEAVPQQAPGVVMEAREDERARVVALSGEHEGTAFEFGSTPIVFGSDPGAQVRLTRSYEVAPRHAQLWIRGGKIMLRHTGGSRPTISGGRAVEWVILEEGDEFAIGTGRYRVEGSVNGSTPSGGRGASS
jgi:hypothetical protein